MIFNLPLTFLELLAYYFFNTFISPIWSSSVWDSWNSLMNSVSLSYFETFVPLFAFLQTFINIKLLFILAGLVATLELLFISLKIFIRFLRYVRVLG